MKNNYCAYYVGHVKKETAWLLTAILRGTEHVVFDRTLDKKESLFEFFVPVAMESVFLEVTKYLKKEQLLLTLTKKPNRFID
ncbi:MAG: hypothetical protein ACJAZS_000784 [Alteromonas naphthalenivorans]|jgi:hypothetical protein